MIDEEAKMHRHSSTYRLNGNILWVRWFDGNWYKHILPSPEMKRPRKSPEDDNTTQKIVKALIAELGYAEIARVSGINYDTAKTTLRRLSTSSKEKEPFPFAKLRKERLDALKRIAALEHRLEDMKARLNLIKEEIN